MSNARPVFVERRVVERQKDDRFVGEIWIGTIEGIKHPALKIEIGVVPIVIPLLLAQDVVAVVDVGAPSTGLLQSFVVEQLALLVEVLSDVRLQFIRSLSHRFDVLLVLGQRLYSLPLLFSLLFCSSLLFFLPLLFFPSILHCFLFSLNFILFFFFLLFFSFLF